MRMQSPKKLIELEALRGLAAVVVLFHHFMLGFTPRLHGMLYPEQPYSLFGTPAFAFVNGSAAVIVFFVLSGFVLTVGVFKSQRAAGVFVAVLKRWPRLALTVMAANALAGLLMAYSLFGNVHTATLVPSIWLGWFYNWQSTGNNEIPLSIIEGATTFFTGASRYNSNLWTMYYEFWGSMIALGCALVLVGISNRLVQGLFLLLAWLVASTFNANMGPFVIGVALAAMYARRSTWAWPNWTMYLIVPTLLFLFGYHENLISGRSEAWYAFLNPVAAQNPALFRVVLHSIGAALALLLFLHVPMVKRAMSGETGRRLGLMSFPIFLSQILVICSISSWTYEALVHAPHVLRILVCLCVTLAGTVLVALPLAALDRWWLQWLGRFSTGAAWKQSSVQTPLP
jgi:peptidoglycan/LPS O-acetylase OafA/YrhL